MPDVAVYRPPQTAEEALAAMRKTRGSHTSIAHEIERAEALEARLAEPDESAEPDELAEPAEPTLEELRARVEAAILGSAPPPAAALPSPQEFLRHLDRLDRAMRQRGGFSAPSDDGVTRFRDGGTLTCVPITVFSDGVLLFRGPFRPWSDAEALVRDVAAGYCPLELRQRYPDGVSFEIMDCADRTHAQGAADAAARGVVGIDDVKRGATMLAPQPPQRLLERLPAAVVRDGRVVPVRAEVAELLGRATDGPAVDADAVRAARLRRFEDG